MLDQHHGGLTWRRSGDRSAPPLVLLHPIAADSSVWAAQIEAWRHRYDVIAIDLPGHGGSAPMTGEPTIGDYATCVAQSLSAGGIRHAAIVGLSLGSMIAQRLAADSPELVRAAVLANGVASIDETTRQAWRSRVEVARAQGMTALRDAMLARWFTADFLDQRRDVAHAIGALIDATPIDGFVQAAGAIERLDNRELLPRITCPTLVVAGAHDQAAPAAAVATIAAAIPGARLATLDAPHLANIEASTSFTAEVGAFLNRALGVSA